MDGLGSCFCLAGFVAQLSGFQQRYWCLVLVSGWSWLVVGRLWFVIGLQQVWFAAGGWSWFMLLPGWLCCPAVRGQAKISVFGFGWWLVLVGG